MHFVGYLQETHQLFKARLPGYFQAMVFLVECVKGTIEKKYVQIGASQNHTEKTTSDIGNRLQISVSISHATSTDFTPLSNLPEV